MTNPVASFIRASTRKAGEPLNILCGCTHERYETHLAKTGHNFYAYQHDGFKEWHENYAKIPANYHILDKSKGEKQLPVNVDFDLVLSQNKFGQFQVLSQIAQSLHLPLVSLEHTLPVPMWTPNILENCRLMRGNINVFISDYSIGQWKWTSRGDTQVIRHGIDTELFKPDSKLLFSARRPVLLSIVNDWINRDWCCNFRGWERIVNGLPVQVYGNTKGFSRPTQTVEELVGAYQNHKIFLNTSTISPVPTSLLEAMACGCACVSTATCMIPEVIEHGVNGLISNDEKELREFCELLLKDDKLARELGKKARETIVSRFNENRFIEEWKQVFEKASRIIFTGV